MGKQIKKRLDASASKKAIIPPEETPSNTEEKVIRVSCKGAGLVALKDIQPMQGELKSLSPANFERLFTVIKRHGITAPIHVWRDEKGVLHNLDGHQRQKVLIDAAQRGWKVPAKVPVVYVEAASYKRAKEILLAHASQYGYLERQGLYDFVLDLEIEPDKLSEGFNFPEVDLKFFHEEFFSEQEDGKKTVTFTAKTGAQEFNEGEFQDFEHHCPRCGFAFNAEKVSSPAAVASPTKRRKEIAA